MNEIDLSDFMRPAPDPDSLTGWLEREAPVVCRLLEEHCDTPREDDLNRVREFLVNVEFWKADCLEEKTGNAVRNAPIQVWNALYEAVKALRTKKDMEALLSVMNLIGFGSSKDGDGMRRAKRATAVLRFLDPKEWGVVDWRTIAIWSFYNKHQRSVAPAITEARLHTKSEMAELFDVIDEKGALGMVEQYRHLRNASLPRTVDVELALYNASFKPWPR